MEKIYSAHGIRFAYPADWELSEEVDERDVVVSVASPETSFWTVSLLAGRPDPARVIREVLETFRGEYAELDEYPAQAAFRGIDCEARDLQFLQYELINSAYLRAFSAGSRTLLILYQGMDRELVEARPVLEKISASLEWDEPPEIMGYY
jgi:hypothetical protein